MSCEILVAVVELKVLGGKWWEVGGGSASRDLGVGLETVLYEVYTMLI